jgi:hypothetical protein
MRSRALIVVAALGAALTGCHSGDDGAATDTGKLTRQQYDAAVNVARHEVETQDARVTSATAVLKHNAGRHAPSNTGHRCTGDQVLKIRLIGTFPHTVTTGTPGGGSTTVTEMDIKADPGTGVACLIGVGTSKHPEPEQGATELQLDETG